MHSQLRQLLRNQILGGAFALLDKLPSEAELSARHSVSRYHGTARAGRPAERGPDLPRPGQGRLRQQSRRHGRNITTLKGFDEAMVPLGHTTRNELLLFDQLPAPYDVADKLGIERDTTVCRIRRLRFLDNLPVSVRRELSAARRRQRPGGQGPGQRADIFLIIENDFSIDLGGAQLALEASRPPAEGTVLGVDEEQTPVFRIERLTFERLRSPKRLRVPGLSLGQVPLRAVDPAPPYLRRRRSMLSRRIAATVVSFAAFIGVWWAISALYFCQPGVFP